MLGSRWPPKAKDELRAAFSAVHERLYGLADSHLDRALTFGASPDEVEEIRRRMHQQYDVEEAKRQSLNGLSGWSGWGGWGAGVTGVALVLLGAKMLRGG